MRYVNFSIGTKDSFLLSRTVAEMQKEHPGIIYSNYDSSDLDDDAELLQRACEDALHADFISFKVHGDTTYMRKFDRLLKAVENGDASCILTCTETTVTDSYRYLFKGNDEDYDRAMSYYVLGGDENIASLIRWALVRFDGATIDVPEPIQPPAQGIYYPRREDIEFESYLKGLDPSRPNIGIFFYQKQWLTGNLNNIDGLIRAVERRGGNPIPVFLKTYEEPTSGSIGIKRLLKEHLTVNGGPVLDCIIETMSFSQTLIATPGCGEQVCDENFLNEYGVPVLQTMTPYSDFETWKADINGLNPAEIAYDAAHPEFDGQIITVPSCSTEKREDGVREYVCIEDRADRVADMACMWADLRRTSNHDRKVAILLYMYPPKTANAGGASGLDTFASVVDVLHRMRADGYDVGDNIPNDSKELVDMMLAGLTNDIEWMSDDEVTKRSVDIVSKEEYDRWYAILSREARERIEKDWGKPPGDFYTADNGLMVPGVVFGKIIVGFQPDRGRDIQKDYHDPNTVMPHQYLGYYRWLRYDFGAQAVIHVGTHGTLEWLPGKSIALSSDCCPDYILDSMPDIYPYIIGNPGEGTQAKRRAAAVIIDHMIPVLARAGSYDEIEELEGTIQRYMGSETQRQEESSISILAKIREIVDRMEMYNDLKIDPKCPDEEFAECVEDLYDYIMDVKGNMIKDGLHILGHPPEGQLMNEAIYCLTRLDNGEVPSLRDSLAECMGFDYRELQDNPSGKEPGTGRLNGEIIQLIEDRTSELIDRMVMCDFVCDGCISAVDEIAGTHNERIVASIDFVCSELYPNLMKMGVEIDSIMNALQGRFIPPGPSGCPSRGRAQLLPTGRNFYSLDPESVPWHSSWKLGMKMADQMLERYIDEHGCYPRTVGIVVWATDTMKTGGDDIAYVLWLMGLRPIWTGYAGRVKDIEIIPTSELGRPRIDVTLRISGLFRDTFPNLVNLIDKGVRMIANLDEDDETNYLAANLRRDVAQAISEGIPEDQAIREASVRIFGDAPGTYGSGTNVIVRTSAWNTVDDIASIYRSYGQYAYGVGLKGESMPRAFQRRLEMMEVTVKNSTSREHDMLDNDDVYNDLGGFNAAVRAARGEMPMSVIGCSADTSRPVLRTVDEEGRYIFRSKINNPKWVEGLKRHGFKGAQEISKMAEYVFGWDATSDIIDPWMYQSIAENFLFDEDNSEWFREANPHAMHDTTEWLLEAIGRGMWEPDKDTKERLEEIYRDLEDMFEGAQ